MKRVLLTIGLGLGIIGLVTALTALKRTPTAGPNKLSVAASFYPLAYFAEQIGGTHVSVTTITPAGTEPHDYDPSAQDIATIEQSRLLILNGGGFEPWAEKVSAGLTPNVSVLTVGNELINRQIQEGARTRQDPHIWLDPVLAKTIAKKISAVLAQLDPANQPYYQARETELATSLDRLNLHYRQGLANCQKRAFVTSHVAFGYLAERYQLTQVALSGISPDEEPSAQDLAKISQFVRANQVKYIFFETLVSPKLSTTVAEETGAKILALNPLEGLTVAEQKNGQTYISVMRTNLTNLQLALECK